MMKKIFTRLVLIFVIANGSAVISPVFSANANLKVNYQGFLRLNGAPVNGTKGFVFRIKNGSGVIQWESQCTNVAISNGIFRATLGDTNAATYNWDTINWKGIDAFLEIARIGDQDTCNNYTTMTSSEHLSAIPYSILASSTAALLSVSGKLKVDSSTVSVNGIDRYFVPHGVIAMWSGTLAQIPTGWALCDGTLGTPNLLNEFLYGVDTGVNPGVGAGSANHTHTIDAHTHDVDIAAFNSGYFNNGRDCPSGGSGALGNHYHSIDPPNTTSGAASTSATSSTSNLPPYYRMAFIMKL